MKYLCAIILFSFLLFGCSKNDSNPSENNSDNNPVKKEIRPLAIGNKWIYQRTDGNTLTREILQKIQFQGEDWFSEKSTSNYYPLYRIKDNGLWQIIAENQTQTLFYKYPCVLGETYGAWKVLSEKISISVTAGKYDCILYQYSAGGGYTEEHYVANGIGLIKMDGKDPNGNVYNSYSLTSYSVK